MHVVVGKREKFLLKVILLAAIVSAVGHVALYFSLQGQAPSVPSAPDFTGKDASRIAIESEEYSRAMALASIRLVTVSGLRSRAASSAIWSSLFAAFSGYMLFRIRK
jgi:hypothetical protein